MSTRLFPCDDTPFADLEQLAQVPAGTHARLLLHEAATPVHADGYYDQDSDYKHWCLLQEDPDMARLDAFLTFGWGRLSDVDRDIIIINGWCNYGGSTSNRTTIGLMLASHDVPLYQHKLVTKLVWW